MHVEPKRNSHASLMGDYLPLKPFIPSPLDPHLIEAITYIGSGGHSRVFRVNIQGNTYALKLFLFTNPLAYNTVSRGRHSESTLRAHYDPFYAECRAYASIIANGLNGTFAPSCHGSITINSAFELMLGQLNPEYGDWERQPGQDNEYVRGILTDFFDGVELAGVKLTREIVDGVRGGIEKMNKIGIAHGDVFSKNILVSIDGRVVWIDFSASWTLPHIVGDVKYQNLLRANRRSVEWMFHILSLVGFIVPMSQSRIFPKCHQLMHVEHISSPTTSPAPSLITLSYHHRHTRMFTMGGTSTFSAAISGVLRLTKNIPLQTRSYND
ncbi:hypothetical protein FGG08_003955 [Glutinoglossum americanum]|uniref:Protein kinase domain-containing protein n=1 Tax=Glutinoglossum americanum TaxID=1670608 RepID=A0A9P8ICD2_9PEZI|nr:hypothetical protein FGG08_003955 [Glutinoglossum americanum]